MATVLHTILGPCGAGKTTYARALARRENAVTFVLDEWMARLFAPDMPEPIQYDWMIERVARCEAQIWQAAAGVMATGTPVVFDIGLMRKDDRARVQTIAEGADLPLQFHFVTAPQDVRRARVAQRNEVRGENFAIDVTPQMFDFIEGVWEEPDADELAGAVISRSA